MIVIDNNKTDATAKIIHSFQKMPSIIEYVFEVVQTTGAALNTVLIALTGDIVMYAISTDKQYL